VENQLKTKGIVGLVLLNTRNCLSIQKNEGCR